MKVVTGEWIALKSYERFERIQEAKRLWDVRFGRKKKAYKHGHASKQISNFLIG